MHAFMGRITLMMLVLLQSVRGSGYGAPTTIGRNPRASAGDRLVCGVIMR
jgi:hypothetical protein